VLPTGTVTFLMTDIEGSTRLLADLGNEYAGLLLAHRAIVRAELERSHGVEVSTEGDSFLCVFVSAVDAVRAAVAVQRCLAAQSWPGGRQVRVRMGLHTGDGVRAGEGYVGMDLHRVARVCAAGHGGQVLLTAATHGLLEGHWPPDVGDVELGRFRLKDIPAPETLHQLVADGLERDFPPPRTAGRSGYAFPTASAPIIGREQDAARVAQLLAEHRLVTLTGPGGVGKTRLALHLGAALRDDFPDGVVFVPLAEVRDPELVPDEIARALALPAAAQAGPLGVTRLAEHLRDRAMLLVLDNVEQLGAGADVVGKLLLAAPGPRVLATSRGPLRLREEQQYPVGPLSREAAVEQFAERARTVRPDLRLADGDREAVERIVDGVGRLPLAVELAAARVGMLSTSEIAARLGSQLGLLSGGPRDLPPRQQGLRSTLDWSYELLDEPARRAFAALAVFPGGATLDALGEVLAGADPLEPLAALVDQGLVRRADEAGGRFTTLQVVREFATERLEESGDGDRVRRRAAARLIRLATAAEPLLVAAERAEGLDRLQAEHDNLRLALAWATEHDPPLAAELAAPLWRYWLMRGYLREGRAVLETLLERLDPADGPGRYAVLTALGGVAYWQRDVPATEAAYAGALRSAEAWGDTGAQAEALFNLAFPVWMQERWDEASALADRSQQLFAERGDDDGVARVIWLRGVVAVLTGNVTDARRLLEDAVTRLRAGPDVFHLGWALRMLGRTLLMQGEAGPARERLRESLLLFDRAGDVSAILLHLADFARLAALEGDVEKEVRLVGAMRRLQRLTGTDQVDHPVNRVPGLEATLAGLGTDGDRLLAEGAAMSDADAVRYALEEQPAS
jgi:predicted ATPase